MKTFLSLGWAEICCSTDLFPTTKAAAPDLLVIRLFTIKQRLIANTENSAVLNNSD